MLFSDKVSEDKSIRVTVNEIAFSEMKDSMEDGHIENVKCKIL